MAHHSANQKAALQWIIEALERHGLPYQIVGGLAAIAYGGTRPLNDIDLYAPLGLKAAGFLRDVAPYTTAPPMAVVEGPWDITFMKLTYEGQKIEIGDSDGAKIQHSETKEWITKEINFNTSVSKMVFGCQIDVMPIEQLIAYKAALGRDVDMQDVRELKKFIGR